VVGQRFFKGFAKTDADILSAVMEIHIDVAFTGKVEVKEPVFGKEGKHMVHKAIAAGDT
jgi:hypothetical protein